MTQKWYQQKISVISALIGSFSILGFAVAMANRQNAPNAIGTIPPKTEPTTFASPQIASSQKPVMSQEVANLSKFGFPKAGCGDQPTGANDNWYPVFVDGGDIDTIRQQFCADAVATVRKDTKVPSVQLASFTSRDRALEFAKAVGGDVGQPTLTEFSSGSRAKTGFSNEVNEPGILPTQPKAVKRTSFSCPVSYKQIQAELSAIALTNYFGSSEISQGDKIISQVGQVYQDSNCQNIKLQIQPSLKLAWRLHLNKKYQLLAEAAQHKTTIRCGTSDDFMEDLNCSRLKLNAELESTVNVAEVEKEHQKEIQTMEAFFATP